MCAAMGALENICALHMRFEPWTCMLPLCSGVPAVVSGSQCCQETLCSPSRSRWCPRQAKHFDQLCCVFLFLGCYHHSHHSQIIACEYSCPISNNKPLRIHAKNEDVIHGSLIWYYSSHFLGTDRNLTGTSDSQNTSPSNCAWEDGNTSRFLSVWLSSRTATWASTAWWLSPQRWADLPG